MLLFRDEEHLGRWLKNWNQPRGEIFSLEQCFGLGRGWYSADRRDPNWRRFTLEEGTAIFSNLDLTSDFWKLG